MKKRKLKKEDLDKMGDLNLDKVLDEISKIDLPVFQVTQVFQFQEIKNPEFPPAILPSEWQKANQSFQEFILNLVLQSYGTA